MNDLDESDVVVVFITSMNIMYHNKRRGVIMHLVYVYIGDL